MEISCQNISYTYPGAALALFEDLSLRITGSGFHALFGPSGVGKTSLARILVGDIGGHGGNVRTDRIRRLAYSYNTERLPGWSAIGHHLDKNIPDSHRELKDGLVHVFGLDECMDRRFSQLSLGQKNRINLVRYLLQDFDFLILDESLANVDEHTRETIILEIKDLFPKTCFLYISHNVVEVSKFCREIFVFRGAHRRPQVLTVQGLDLKTGQTADSQKLNHTMLEIMNAS